MASNVLNRVALVTGSTSGIGLGIARVLASRGCSVILNGHRSEDLVKALKEELISTYSVRVDYVRADLTKAEAVDKMCKDVKALHPDGVDIIVNNAGMQNVSRVEDFPMEKWNDLVAILLTAPFQIIKHLMPDMKRKGWGRIVNISSVMGLVAAPNWSAYVSCKHGLNGLTKVVALETAGSGVTCNSICPGAVITPLLQAQIQAKADRERISYEESEKRFVDAVHPTKTPVQAQHLGEVVAFLCSEAASQMTGTTIPVDGGCVIR